jgi:hydrogenase 3 maturation protease
VAVSELKGFRAGSVQDLKMRLREIGTRRLVIVGVGNPLKGDDFAGSFIVKRLKSKLPRMTDRVLLLDAETTPESFVEQIRAFEPEATIFIDSAVAGCPPGTINLTDLEKTQYPYFCTHSVPLKLLGSVIGDSGRSFLLGIEPKTTEFGEKMSNEVKLACSSIVEAIYKTLKEAEETGHG